MRSGTDAAIVIPEDPADLSKRYGELLAVCSAQARLIEKLKNRLTHGLYSFADLQVLHAIPFDKSICTLDLHKKFGNDPVQRKKTLRSIRRLKEKKLVVNVRPSSQFGFYRRTINEI